MWKDSYFATEAPEKIALVSRAPDEIKIKTVEMETLIRNAMYESKRFSVVKDGRDFPNDFKAAQILASQDFAFLCILDGYSAPENPRFELNCFRKTDESFLSFLGTQNELKTFVESKTFNKGKSKPVVVEKKPILKAVEKNEVAEEVERKSRLIITEQQDDKRLYFDPTRKDSRRILVGRERTRLDHAEFYELVGEPEFKETYLETGTLRSTLFIAGSAAIAVGAGLIFGGALSNAQCGNDESCKSDLLTILGGTTLGLGGISIATGFFINRYPTSSKEDKEAIDLYNKTKN